MEKLNNTRWAESAQYITGFASFHYRYTLLEGGVQRDKKLRNVGKVGNYFSSENYRNCLFFLWNVVRRMGKFYLKIFKNFIKKSFAKFLEKNTPKKNNNFVSGKDLEMVGFKEWLRDKTGLLVWVGEMVWKERGRS